MLHHARDNGNRDSDFTRLFRHGFGFGVVCIDGEGRENAEMRGEK